MSEVWHRTNMLNKERRDLISKLMEPYEEHFRIKRKEIMEICEAEGHTFRFTNIGPLGYAWFNCTKCGKSRVDDE